MMMKCLVVTAAVLALVSRSYAQWTCYTCDTTTITGFNGESTSANCYKPAITGASSTPSCGPNDATNTFYCKSVFTIQDGMVINVGRSCETNTETKPASECTTVLSQTATGTGPVDATTCSYRCSTANCNSQTAASLKTCSSDCNRPSSGGFCNYITGSCVCQSGFSGADCTGTVTISTTKHQCVQCDSDTDSDCTTSTSGFDCPSGEQYCSSASTAIYDDSNNVPRTITTRGCTAVPKVVDQCRFTNIFNDDGITSSNYREFTCLSTCATDNCNTNTPNGIVDGTEEKTLYCLQCTLADGLSTCRDLTSAARTLCPKGTTHCKSSVTYVMSETVDLNHQADPSYEILSLVRECATTAVTSACTDTNVGTLSMKNVTCEETCQTDGCNDGWPARPKCLRCDSSTDSACLETPDFGVKCEHPHQQYCYLEHIGIEKDKLEHIKGYPRRMIRGCSYWDRGTGCAEMVFREDTVQSCNRTCSTDHCNVGSDSNMPLQTVVAVMFPTVLGWFIQRYV